MPPLLLIDLLLASAALVMALALQPWRALGADGPPWPWLAWGAVLPLLWGADRYAAMPIVQPLSGAAFLVLCAGWPLAMRPELLTRTTCAHSQRHALQEPAPGSCTPRGQHRPRPFPATRPFKDVSPSKKWRTS